MSVKRYRVSYAEGVIEDYGQYFPSTCSHPMVLATNFDALANELQAAQCAEKMTADSLAEARAMNTKLANALEECANRFEKCCVHAGSDREMATLAVSDYRALIEVCSACKNPQDTPSPALREAAKAERPSIGEIIDILKVAAHRLAFDGHLLYSKDVERAIVFLESLADGV